MSITNDMQAQTLTDRALATSFPPNFLWGAATASYQIEGAAHEDGRGPSIWDVFSATPGKVFRGDTGDIAADHYHRMPDDVALMARLGLAAYRFSIAWPRILPQGRGTVQTTGLDFYDRLVDALLAKGIKPFATLYHWDLPTPLQENGGWTNRDTAYAFADYAEIVVQRLGDRVTSWTTHNEPWCAAYLGYGIGIHAPGIRNRQDALTAAHHLLLSHGLAVPRIRAHMSSSAQVGITLNPSPVYPADDRAETRRDVELADLFSNRWFLDPIFRGSYPDHLFSALGLVPPDIHEGDLATISTPIDFLGINTYSRVVITGQETPPLADACQAVGPIAGSTYTSIGWEVYPQALEDILVRVQRDYAPPALYVTENGAAFDDVWDGGDLVVDRDRVDYLRGYIRACGRAIEQGVPLKGYFVWSLMDNFEWQMGYRPRFGLTYVDYPTQQRFIKASGYWYAHLIASGELD